MLTTVHSHSVILTPSHATLCHMISRFFLATIIPCSLITSLFAVEGEGPEPLPKFTEPSSLEEARSRARLLNEAISGALQVMHRDFFESDGSSLIPSASLEDVFDVIESEWGVSIRWMAVNAKVMDSDHKPEDAFDKDVVRAFTKGLLEIEHADANSYRYAGAIQLHNECLKCHVPFRTSLEDRVAALTISMPLQDNDEGPSTD